MSTSVGEKTSSIPVIELTVVPPSLIESAAMCEWQSMMPGEMNLPAASTTSAPAGIGDVRADCRHLAVAQDDRSVLDRPLGDGENRAALDGDHRGWSRLRGEGRERKHQRESG